MAALRERALLHGRSMQEEIRQILARAATEPMSTRAVEPVRLTTVRTSGTSAWVRDELYGDDGR